MKKLVLALVVLVVVGAGVWAVYDRQIPPSPVQPDRARVYATAVGNLGTSRPDPDAAITALNGLRREDPRNGMTGYFLAAAHSRKRDWPAVQREVQEGNKAPYFLYYVPDADTIPMTPTPGYATLRQMVRDCAAAAPKLPAKTAVALMYDLRGMAGKVAQAEPRGLIPVLVGCALRTIVDRSLVAAAGRTGSRADLDQARRLESADKAWANRTRADFKAAMQNMDTAALVRKHFTEQEWNETQGGAVVTTQTRPKFAAMRAELEAVERPLAEKALKAMPE